MDSAVGSNISRSNSGKISKVSQPGLSRTVGLPVFWLGTLAGPVSPVSQKDARQASQAAASVTQARNKEAQSSQRPAGKAQKVRQLVATNPGQPDLAGGAAPASVQQFFVSSAAAGSHWTMVQSLPGLRSGLTALLLCRRALDRFAIRADKGAVQTELSKVRNIYASCRTDAAASCVMYPSLISLAIKDAFALDQNALMYYFAVQYTAGKRIFKRWVLLALSKLLRNLPSEPLG